MKRKISFLWQGVNGRYGHWKDGLWKAMKIIEKTYAVKYCEPTDDIDPDSIVLYWEAPCTILGEHKEIYKRVQKLPNKKALLFAGGPIKREWLEGFDHVFVESKINADELTDLNIPHSTAFGINEMIFKPMSLPKKWDGIHAGTCASWKRQGFIGEALGDKGIVVGRPQESDSFGFDRCKELGATVLLEQTPEDLAKLINQTFVCVQTSALMGGGQRATLEAMACNIPVICMSDSPKNREFVEESGNGLVVDPDPQRIANAVVIAKSTDWGTKGRDYVLSKWTSKIYASNLLLWINQQ